MSDPWLSLIILTVCVVGGWIFLVWDRRMEQRHRDRLDAEIEVLERLREQREEE